MFGHPHRNHPKRRWSRDFGWLWISDVRLFPWREMRKARQVDRHQGREIHGWHLIPTSPAEPGFVQRMDDRQYILESLRLLRSLERESNGSSIKMQFL